MKPQRPHVLFFLTDQWIHDWLGFQGHPWVRTPHLDRLAKGATCFRNAFCGTPLCYPSWGSLLTGAWPHQSGVLDNLEGLGQSRQLPLARDRRTWLDAAKEAGYRIGYFGKWHLGANGPLERGVYGYPERGVEPESGRLRIGPHADEKGNLVVPSCRKVAQGFFPPFYRTLDEAAEATQSGKIATEALRFLENNEDPRPWLLTVSFYGPHFPHDVPAAILDSFADEEVTLPQNFGDDFAGKPWFHGRTWWDCHETECLSEEDWKRTIRACLGMLALVDAQIGRVMERAREAAGDHALYVAFAADHGEMLGAHGRFDKGAYFYDEVWRTPMLLRTPEDGWWAAPGEEDSREVRMKDHFVNLLDLGATFFDLFGDTAARAGRSLLQLLINPSEAGDFPDRAYGSYNYYNGHAFAVRAVRDRKWKYVFNPQAVDELYDLATDPGELANRIEDLAFAERRATLRKELFSWMERMQDPLARLVPEHLPPAGSFADLGPGLVRGKAPSVGTSDSPISKPAEGIQ